MDLKKIPQLKSSAFDAYFEVSTAENIGIQGAMSDIISRVSKLEKFRQDSDSDDTISPGHVSGLFLMKNP